MPILIYENGALKSMGNTRQYSGEKIPGDLRSWPYLGSDPNAILRDTYDILSQRSVTLYHTHPPIASAINKHTHYGIGPGLVYKSHPDWEVLGVSREYAKSWSMQFQKLIHYMFLVLNFYEKQSILFRTALIQGDSLLFFDRGYDPGLPFDLIEAGGDSIDIKGKTKYKRKSSTLGIVHDDYLRKSGIITTDGREISFTDSNNDQNVIQLMFKQMARQLRGYSLAYKIISMAKNNDRWWDATLSRMVMETIMMGYSNEEDSENSFINQVDDYSRIVRKDQNIAGMNTTQSESVEGADNSVTTLYRTKDMTPGAMLSYKGNGKMQFTDLKAPVNNFKDYNSEYIKMVGMSTETPPEVVTGEYNTSFTAHKGALNDFKKVYEFKRRTAIQTAFKPVVREIAKFLFINKLIDVPNPLFFSNAIIQEATIAGNWLGPVPGHINPLQEVNADAKAVENAFELRSNVAEKYGNQYDNFIEEWTQNEREYQKMNPDMQAQVLENDLLGEPQKSEDGVVSNHKINWFSNLMKRNK